MKYWIWVLFEHFFFENFFKILSLSNESNLFPNVVDVFKKFIEVKYVPGNLIVSTHVRNQWECRGQWQIILYEGLRSYFAQGYELITEEDWQLITFVKYPELSSCADVLGQSKK